MNSTSDREIRLGRNLGAGVASTAWTAIVTIGTVPLYLHFLGVEAYGLIGFYVALQGMLAVLDLGLSQSINREIARALSADERAAARNLLHTLAFGYWAAALGIGLAMWASADWLARSWLSSSIDPTILTDVIAIMGLTVACRFPLGLYLGALIGAHRLELASGIEIAMVTLTNLGAVLILWLIVPTIKAFFIWQAVMAILNILVVRASAWFALRDSHAIPVRVDLGGLKRIWRFSAGVAITAILGAVFVQADKVVLSKIVSLTELGLYTLAGIAARSLYVLTAPTFNTIYPQMSSYHAQGRFQEIAKLYRLGTRLLMAVLFPATIFLTVFSIEVFTLWTGDAELSKSISLIVGILLMGTALNGAMHFPYALQLAYGESSLPMIINLTLFVVFVPVLILLSLRFGIIGAAAAWAVHNTLYLFYGTWLTHRKILPGVGLRWLAGDVGGPLLVSLLLVGVGGSLLHNSELPPAVAAGIGLALAAFSFAATFWLTPGLAQFARETFLPRAAQPGLQG